MMTYQMLSYLTEMFGKCYNYELDKTKAVQDITYAMFFNK